jgi:hypothetical protein
VKEDGTAPFGLERGSEIRGKTNFVKSKEALLWISPATRTAETIMSGYDTVVEKMEGAS